MFDASDSSLITDLSLEHAIIERISKLTNEMKINGETVSKRAALLYNHI